jgi:hypothetical protein
MMSFSSYFVLCAVMSARVIDAASFQEGDTCGVSSTDFLTYDFRSEFLVAGEKGCTLGESTNCYCAPNLSDGESLSEWKWQCNGSVKFGPTGGDKICPDSVPVTKGLGDLDVILNRRSLQIEERVSCDTTINPTGRPGDEVCPYSDCDEGGDHSAICACIDLEQYGMGEGMEWICMHATCNCGENEESETGEMASSASSSSGLVFAFVPLLAMGAFQ